MLTEDQTTKYLGSPYLCPYCGSDELFRKSHRRCESGSTKYFMQAMQKKMGKYL